MNRRAARVVTAVGLVIILGSALWAGRVGYDHNLLHLQDGDLDSVKWELTLIKHTAGASWHAQSYTGTAAEALALKGRYEALPEVARVVEVASLVPPDQDRKLAQLRDIQHRLRHLPARGAGIPHDRPRRGDLQALVADLLALLRQRPDGEPAALLGELRGALQRLGGALAWAAEQAVVEGRLQTFEESLARDLASDLHRLREVSRPAPVTLDDLPPALRERYVGKSGKWLLQVFPRETAQASLWDFGPLEHFAQQVRTVDPEATGKPFATVEGLRAMKQGFEWAGLYALLAIVAVLLCDFRSLRHTLIALAPLAMGLLLALGVMGVFGVPLNPANMIALPLVLGVGVDNGVHLLHDYLASKAEGRGRLSRAIGRGVLVKALTTMIGFGTLMISRQLGLSGLGFCLTLGVACCMVASLVFLPAVLRVLAARRATDADPAVLPLPARRAARAA